jgi:hypothetical protein
MESKKADSGDRAGFFFVRAAREASWDEKGRSS